MNTNPVLVIPERIARKLSPSSVTKGDSWSCSPGWGGYLTPIEILILDKLGVIEYFSGTTDEVARAKKAKKEGKSNPSWIYFRLKNNVRFE